MRPDDDQKPAWRRLLWPTVAVIPAFVLLVGLGVWQLDRLGQKRALIEAVDQRITEAPVEAPGPDAWGSFDAAAWDYRPVAVRGRFLPGELYYYSALSQPQGRFGGPGYFVLAPFRTSDGWIVLINRGFVPDSMRDPAARLGSEPPDADIAVEGLLRRPEQPNVLTPAPDLGKRIWFARTPDAMARSLGLRDAPIAPYTIDAGAEATPAGGLPQAGETVVRFSNNHLQYALTWFGLAAVLVAVFIAFARTRLQSRTDR